MRKTDSEERWRWARYNAPIMSESRDSNGDTTVLQPPDWLRYALMMLGLASLIYLVFTRPDSVEALRADFWAILAILCIVITPIAFVQRRRVELCGDEIREYVGSHLKHRIDIREIDNIRTHVGRKTLIFRGGQRIEINDLWPHANEIIAMFQVLLDAKNRE